MEKTRLKKERNKIMKKANKKRNGKKGNTGLTFSLNTWVESKPILM